MEFIDEVRKLLREYNNVNPTGFPHSLAISEDGSGEIQDVNYNPICFFDSDEQGATYSSRLETIKSSIKILNEKT